MARAKETGFDTFLRAQLRDPKFAKKYARARAEVDAVDRIVRALDEARIDVGMSKAELARQISAKPEIVRRLFTSKSANPTLATVVKVASALGFTLVLASARGRRSERKRAAA